MNLSPIAQERRIDRLFALGITANLILVTTMVTAAGRSPLWLLISGGALLGLVVYLLRRHGGTAFCATGLSLAWATVAIATVTALPDRIALSMNMVLVMSLLPWYRRWHLVVALGLVFAITPVAVGVPGQAMGLWVFAGFMLVQTAFMALMAHRYDLLSRQVFDIEFLVHAMGKDGPVRLDLSVLRAETEIGNRLKNVQERVALTLAQVQTSAHETRQAADLLQINGQSLAARTQKASSDLDGTALTLSQISSIVKNSAEAAVAARETAQAASVLAVQGGQTVGQMVEQMKSIDDASRRIADIVGVIDGIAFQTNMLALNAAVEAARAGEQGRGFAVVAAEVRMLAQRASASAGEIKSVVERSEQAVTQGRLLADQAEQTMQNLTAAVARVDQTFHTLSADTHQHASGIEALRDSIHALNRSTQQNLRVAEQTQSISVELAGRAASLEQSMTGFRLTPGLDANTAASPAKAAAAAPSSAANRPAATAKATVAKARTRTAAPATASPASLAPAPKATGVGSNVEFL